MIEFNKITLNDKSIINNYLSKTTVQACDYCFSNIFMWQYHYTHLFSIVDDLLIIKMTDVDKSIKFWFPIGEHDPIKLKQTALSLMQYCKELGINLVFTRVTEVQKELMEDIFGDTFTTQEDRDSSDYIYHRNDLLTLAGKKYHQKRNHINRFNENNWVFEPMTKDNLMHCINFNNQWCDEVSCDKDSKEISDHICAVCLALTHLDELDMIGGIIRVDGNIVAMSAGSKLNSNTFVVHIEKALGDLQGAYPAINQQFALFASQYFETTNDTLEFFNREEDLGLDGLRKAKLSYYPSHLITKYELTATL